MLGLPLGLFNQRNLLSLRNIDVPDLFSLRNEDVPPFHSFGFGLVLHRFFNFFRGVDVEDLASQAVYPPGNRRLINR